MEKKEMIAAGWYFGISNLAMEPISPKILIEKFGSNWEEIRRELDCGMQGMMETDDMYEMARDEIQWWISKIEAGDKWCIEEWEKLKKGGN